MFSGIIETTSFVQRIEDSNGERRVWVRRPAGWKLRPGESVSVEGVCSTIQDVNRQTFRVIYMPETLRRTTLKNLRSGKPVNLERSLTLGSLVGGHLVQGHVDATARIRSVRKDGDAKLYEFEFPERWGRYLVEKGSVAVDGVSLTIVKAPSGRFTVSLLNYTLNHTTLGGKTPGEEVNIEVDILAKYAEKLLAR